MRWITQESLAASLAPWMNPLAPAQPSSRRRILPRNTTYHMTLIIPTRPARQGILLPSACLCSSCSALSFFASASAAAVRARETWQRRLFSSTPQVTPAVTQSLPFHLRPTVIRTLLPRTEPLPWPLRRRRRRSRRDNSCKAILSHLSS